MEIQEEIYSNYIQEQIDGFQNDMDIHYSSTIAMSASTNKNHDADEMMMNINDDNM